MAENTELQLVQQQANNITRQIATLKSDTENAVQANRKSYEACVNAGESLLFDIGVSGMNDALDERAAEFIKKAKLTEKAMTEKRKGVTQVFDIVRKGFTMMENLISIKNTDSVVYKIQEKRNEYAAYKLEQQRKAGQERLRQERIKEAERRDHRRQAGDSIHRRCLQPVASGLHAWPGPPPAEVERKPLVEQEYRQEPPQEVA